MTEKELNEFALQELMLWAAFNSYYDLAVLLWQQSGGCSATLSSFLGFTEGPYLQLTQLQMGS